MECVGCTACIDACDHMMEKTGRLTGLIRYASENGIANHEPLQYTMRMKLYSGLLGVLVMILAALLISRSSPHAAVADHGIDKPDHENRRSEEHAHGELPEEAFAE